MRLENNKGEMNDDNVNSPTSSESSDSENRSAKV